MTSLDVLLLVLVGGCSILTVINIFVFLRRKTPQELAKVEIDQIIAALAVETKIARKVLPVESRRLKQMMKREKEKNNTMSHESTE